MTQKRYTERLTQWLALGAHFGALIGIVVLILELNQTHELTRAQIRHELAVGIVGLLQEPASNRQLSDLLYRAKSGGKLSPEDHFQLELRTNALFRYWEDVHYQYRAGLYERSEFERQRDAWREALNRGTAPGRDYWCEVRGLYSSEFRAEMDALLPADTCRTAS